MWRRPQGNEELTPVRPRTTVRHRKRPLLSMLQARMELILELPTRVDRSTTTTRAGRVTALDHEAGDDAVEDDVVVFAGGSKGGEVAAGLVVRR